MDPFSALAVAASVVQFVDFTSKIFLQGYAAYKSADGATEEDVDLQALTSDLEEISNSLVNAPPGKQKLSQDEIALRNLARRCSKLALELSLALESLKVQKHGIWRSWSAFRKAIERVMADGKLQKMKKQLDEIRSQVVVHMLHVVKNSQSALVAGINTLTINAQAMHVENSVRLDDLKQSLLDALTAHVREVDNVKRIEDDIIDTAHHRKDDDLEASQRCHTETIESYKQTLSTTRRRLDELAHGI